MIGGCIIDGVDIALFGAFIERDGSNSLLVFPSRTTPEFNDWAEYDGLDVDLSDLSFEAKKVSIKYVITADDGDEFEQRLNNFQLLHLQAGYREVYIREYGITVTLRFLNFTSFKQTGGIVKSGKKRAYITANYIMDNPLQIFTEAVAPFSNNIVKSHILLNKVDLGDWGIIVQSAYSTLLLPRSRKETLTINSHYRDGLWADVNTDEIGKKPREIVIGCTMLADDVSELINNLSSLFNVMKSTSAVRIDAAKERMLCYYTKMTDFVKRAPFKRRVKVSFNLHLQEFSEVQTARLLAAEDEKIIITEDGFAINLS